MTDSVPPPQTEKAPFRAFSEAFAIMLDHGRGFCIIVVPPTCEVSSIQIPMSSRRPVPVTGANAVDRLTEGFSSNPAARHRSGRNNPEATPKSSQNLYRGGWADGRDRAPPKAAIHRERCGNPERASDTDDFQCSIIKGCTHRPLFSEFNAAGSAWRCYREVLSGLSNRAAA